MEGLSHNLGSAMGTCEVKAAQHEGTQNSGRGGRGRGSVMALRPAAVVGLWFPPLTPSSKCPLEARPVGSTEELLPGTGQGRAGGHGGRAEGTGVTDSPLVHSQTPECPGMLQSNHLAWWNKWFL